MSQFSRPIEQVEGPGIPIDGNDVDTDRIIPARYMKSITFEGLGEKLFYDARFDESGHMRSHPLNDPQFQDGKILVTGKNFGCGSSREHAPQSLKDYGVSAIIGESFAEIFAGNCTAIGLPVVSVAAEIREKIASQIMIAPETIICIDLTMKSVNMLEGSYPFSMPESARNLLITGNWDTTSVLLEARGEIEKKRAFLPYIDA